MKLKEKIMIERLSKLSELQPGEQEEVLRDPQLQAALVENRLLGEQAADAPPAPLMKPTLEQALSRPKPREVSTMSVRTLFAGKKWYTQAAIAAVLVAVVAVAAMYWQQSQAGPVRQGITGQQAGYRIMQTSATDNGDGTYNAKINLAGVRTRSADQKRVTLTLAIYATSTLSAEDAARHARDMEKYERECAEYAREINGQASVRPGVILAGGDRHGFDGGSTRVVAQPTPPIQPAVPATVIARAMGDEVAAVGAAVAKLVNETNAGGIDTPGFCGKIEALLSAKFDPALGSIDSVEVSYININ